MSAPLLAALAAALGLVSAEPAPHHHHGIGRTHADRRAASAARHGGPTRPRALSLRAGSWRAGPPADLDALLMAAAARHGVAPVMARAIVATESGWRCAAVSPSGARGAMQVMPRTARAMGVAGELTDCATGVEAGMRYLARAVALGGPGCVGASLYNAGLGAPRRCTAYGRAIMARMGGAS